MSSLPTDVTVVAEACQAGDPSPELPAVMTSVDGGPAVPTDHSLIRVADTKADGTDTQADGTGRANGSENTVLEIEGVGRMVVSAVPKGNSRKGRQRKHRGQRSLKPADEVERVWAPRWAVHFDHPDKPPATAPQMALDWLQENIKCRFNPRLQTMIEGSYTFRNGLKQNHADVKCPRCWMIPRLCFCAVIAPIPKCNVDVVVYMHWKEASNRKASNTAKLVPMLLPGGTLVVVGDVEAEARMHYLLRHSDRAAILFPSPTAVTIADWVAGFGAAGSSPDTGTAPTTSAPPAPPATAAPSPPSTKLDGCADAPADAGGDSAASPAALCGWQPESRCTIVVLDGTWSDAKFLNKAFPAAVPRVKLSAVPGELEKLRTRWAHPEKLNIQSFNAVIQAIEETGLSTDSAAATTVELTDKLREAIEFYTKQTFKEKEHKNAMTRHVWEDAKSKNPGATLAELSALMEKTRFQEEAKSER